MKCLQMVRIGGACACLLSAGCASVRVSDEDWAKIDALNREGITWRGEAEKETFQPVVKMGPAVLWSFLPGAGQHFIAHKMLDGGFYDGSFSGSRLKLQAKGTLMIGVSWFPFIYPFTLISGMTGSIVDVNRMNNLALLESRMDPTTQKPNAQEPRVQNPSTQKAEVRSRRVKRGTTSVEAVPSPTPVSPSLTPEQKKLLEKLEELEALHTAGLCPDDDYARRRTAIRMEELEALHTAGLCSDDDYARRRTAILMEELKALHTAGLCPDDDYARRRTAILMEELEALHTAGLCSDDDYARRRTAILMEELKALHTAGLCSDDDYARRRTAILMEELKALHTAGLCSDDDYARRRTAILMEK